MCEPDQPNTGSFTHMADVLGRGAASVPAAPDPAASKGGRAPPGDASPAAIVLAGTLLEAHVYPVPFAPSLAGQARRPPSEVLGHARPVVMQAFVALRLHGDSAAGGRYASWSKRAYRWCDAMLGPDSIEDAVALALRAVAEIAADQQPAGAATRVCDDQAAWPAAPEALERCFGVPCTSSPALKHLSRAVADLRDELDDPEAEDPLVPHGPPGVAHAERAAAWLRLLVASARERPGADRAPSRRSGNWRVTMFRDAASRVTMPSPPTDGTPAWSVLLDAGRWLCRQCPPLEMAYGVELDAWQQVLLHALAKGEEPARQRERVLAGPDWPPPLPAAGVPLPDHAANAKHLRRLLKDAHEQPALEAELHARYFLRVALSELFLAGRFEPSTCDSLLRPLVTLLRRLSGEARNASHAQMLIEALARFTWFGGAVRIDEKFPDALGRLGYDAARAISARRGTRTREQAEADGPLPDFWLDPFRPGAAGVRASRLRCSGAAGRALCAPFDSTFDIGLMVADAMRDVLLLSHWEQVAGQEPAPGFKTWKEQFRDTPAKGLALERQRDRSILAAIVARMTEDGYVQRLRDIVRELSQRAPAAMTRERA